MATTSLEMYVVYSGNSQGVTSPPYFQPDGNNHEQFLYSDSLPYEDLLQYNYRGMHA